MYEILDSFCWTIDCFPSEVEWPTTRAFRWGRGIDLLQVDNLRVNFVAQSLPLYNW